DMLALHSVEGGLVHMTIGDLTEVRETDFEKNDEPVPRRHLEHVVKGELGRRQQRFTGPVRERWCGLLRGGLECQSLTSDATWRSARKPPGPRSRARSPAQRFRRSARWSGSASLVAPPSSSERSVDHAEAPAGRCYSSGSAERSTGFSKPPSVTGSETCGSSAPPRAATRPLGATSTSWSTSNRGEPFLT